MITRILLGISMLSISGCTQHFGKQGSIAQPSPAVAIAPSIAKPAPSLVGTWRLTSVSGKSVPDAQLTVEFTPQFFYARVNCNQVSGYYTVRDTLFVPNSAVASERGCGKKFEFDAFLTRTLQFGMTLAILQNDRFTARADDRELVFVRTSSLR